MLRAKKYKKRGEKRKEEKKDLIRKRNTFRKQENENRIKVRPEKSCAQPHKAI